MPLEHAVGQTSSTLKHGARLVQHLFKAHDVFSSPCLFSNNVHLLGRVFYTRFGPEKQCWSSTSRPILLRTPLREPAVCGGQFPLPYWQGALRRSASHCPAFSLGILPTNAALHAARPLAFCRTLPHTGVPGAHGGESTECVQYPWGSPRHEERMLWPEFRWIWRTKKT